MLKRLRIYLKEMFPLEIYVPVAFLNHYILFFTAQMFLNIKQPILSFYSLIGVFTILGIMLIMRVFDELKDVEIDKKLFANRPYPRGDVKKKDIVILASATFVLIVIINLFRSYTLPFFLICIVFCFLTFKWFFFKKIISKNLLLALITHQPITFLINLYVVSAAMVQALSYNWSIQFILLSVIFFLPVLAWEISRKIKPLGLENEYVTYSKIFGPRLAAFINFFVLAIFSVSLIWLGIKFELYWLHTLIQLIALGYLTFNYMKFISYPIEKNLNLKITSEIWPAVIIFIYLVSMIIKYGVNFRWF